MASRKPKSGHKRANAGPGASTTGSLSRREFMAWAAGVGVASPLLLGLGVSSSSVAADAAQPRKGGSLVMVISGDPPTLSADVTTGVPDVSIGSLIYDGLTRIDENFKPVPNLAESWTISPDNTRYSFRLVQTKWHDGRDFTSKDVKFTLEEISAKYGAKFAATASHVKSITTPDARTVVIDLDKPFGPLLFSLSNYTNAAIMPEHLFASTNILTNPTTLMQPVGTGRSCSRNGRVANI